MPESVLQYRTLQHWKPNEPMNPFFPSNTIWYHTERVKLDTFQKKRVRTHQYMNNSNDNHTINIRIPFIQLGAWHSWTFNGTLWLDRFVNFSRFEGKQHRDVNADGVNKNQRYGNIWGVKLRDINFQQILIFYHDGRGRITRSKLLDLYKRVMFSYFSKKENLVFLINIKRWMIKWLRF